MGEKNNVTNRIMAYIAKNIQKKNWTVGEKIPSENEICKTLGVSRVSVRRALQQFIALGILESSQGKGTFLKNDDMSAFSDPTVVNEEIAERPESLIEMTDLLEFRLIIEPEVCAKVAADASLELITRLEELLEQMQKSIKDTDEFVRADMKFHLAICEAVGNPIMTSVMVDIGSKKQELYKHLNHVVGSYGGIYYHTLILDALRKHDQKRAYNIMKEHLEHSIGDLAIDFE